MRVQTDNENIVYNNYMSNIYYIIIVKTLF